MTRATVFSKILFEVLTFSNVGACACYYGTMMVAMYAMESKSCCIDAKYYLPAGMLAGAVILDIMIYSTNASKHQEQLLVKERHPQYSNASKCKAFPSYLLTNIM